MNERRIITMLAAAILLMCVAGCREPIVIQGETTYQEVAAVEVDSPEDANDAGDDSAIPITFDDLNLNLEIDVPFREEKLTDRVKELAGKRVRLTGVMHGSVLNLKHIEEFILLRNKDGKYGPGMIADTLVEVKLKSGTSTKYIQDRFEVEGTLRIEPKTGDDGNTWSLYILEKATLPIAQSADN